MDLTGLPWCAVRQPALASVQRQSLRNPQCTRHIIRATVTVAHLTVRHHMIMILNIDMPLAAANTLKTIPPPQGVTIESVDQQMTNIDPGGSDITVTVTLSLQGAVFVASVIAIWIKSAFKKPDQKRMRANGRTIELDSDDYSKRIEQACEEVRKQSGSKRLH